jgi:nucleotide-binding universal stress UspA family protein
MPEEAEFRIRRILVALDASPQSLAAMEAAVQLAAILQADLEGLFVEDINLFRLAELPFSHEVGSYSARARRINSEDIRRQLHAHAQLARRRMLALAERSNLRWSFRVTRGAITQEIKAAAAKADLLVMGRTGWSRKYPLGSTARTLVVEHSGNALVLEERVQRHPSILTLFDGSESSHRALLTAASLAKRREGFITVAVQAENSSVARERQKAANVWLRKHGFDARFRWILGDVPESLRKIAQTERCLVVIPAEVQWQGAASLTDLLEQLQCPVYLVR